MRIVEINLYKYKELSEQAQKKALDKFIEYNHYDDMLSEILHESLKIFLEDVGIESIDEDKLKIYYSIGYSQGDGVCFIGEFRFKDSPDIVTTVDHHSRYYHKKSTDISSKYYNKGDEYDITQQEAAEIVKVSRKFRLIYYEICDKLEKEGYDFIEHEDSEENFEALCDMNDWEFYQNGRMY
jgi:hypothetical protein